jgi:hypothetical protein
MAIFMGILGDFHADDFFALVVAAVGADAVGQFRALALGTFRERTGLDFPVGTALVPALARMTPFWIRHFVPPVESSVKF